MQTAAEQVSLGRLRGGTRWLAFAALQAFVLIGLASRLPGEPLAAAVATTVAIGAGVTLVRAPERFALPSIALVTAAVVVLGSGQASNVGWFAVCVLGAWCMYENGVRTGVAYWVAALAIFAAEWLAGDHDPGWGAWAVGVSCTVGATLLVRRERLLVLQLRAAHAGLAQRSRAEERGRIVRELHDVIAHSLTVSLLHISSARLTVEYEPADAAAALAEAERLSRESLQEVRSIMGTLRAGPGEATAVPAPQLAGVRDLIEQFRLAGAEVALELEGDVDAVPATVGATAYRIVQESLTNAAKHAPGAPISVRVGAQRSTVELFVESGGAPRGGDGLGLDGMRERAHAVGGSCDAGPGGGGWVVHATLPIGDRRAPAHA